MAADAEALEHYRQAEAAYMKVAAQELTPLQRAMLDRKLGQAFYGVGNYDQAVEHFSRALAHLGIRYPRTRGGVRRSIGEVSRRAFPAAAPAGRGSSDPADDGSGGGAGDLDDLPLPGLAGLLRRRRALRDSTA